MTYNEIVSDYIQQFRNGAREEMRSFENEPSLAAAIRRAALCELPDGKRHPHQCLIKRTILEQAELRLRASARSLAKAADFDALYRLVDERVGGIDGIGELTVYDTAHRIGAYIGKKPARVYLHRGTRIGARSLGIRGNVFDPKVLPKPFSRLAASEIEDCLCIYKDKLRDAGSGNNHTGLGCRVLARPQGCL